jgi:hypothetical protein
MTLRLDDIDLLGGRSSQVCVKFIAQFRSSLNSIFCFVRTALKVSTHEDLIAYASKDELVAIAFSDRCRGQKHGTEGPRFRGVMQHCVVGLAWSRERTGYRREVVSMY